MLNGMLILVSCLGLQVQDKNTVFNLIEGGLLSAKIIEVERHPAGLLAGDFSSSFTYRIRVEVLNRQDQPVDMYYLPTLITFFDDDTRGFGYPYKRDTRPDAVYLYTHLGHGDRIIDTNCSWTGNFFMNISRTTSATAKVKRIAWEFWSEKKKKYVDLVLPDQR